MTGFISRVLTAQPHIQIIPQDEAARPLRAAVPGLEILSVVQRYGAADINRVVLFAKPRDNDELVITPEDQGTVIGAGVPEDEFGESIDDLREIESAAAEITVQGARYPEHLQRMTGR